MKTLYNYTVSNCLSVIQTSCINKHNVEFTKGHDRCIAIDMPNKDGEHRISRPINYRREISKHRRKTEKHGRYIAHLSLASHTQHKVVANLDRCVLMTPCEQ